MDIKEKINEIVEKITKDKDLRGEFQKDPVKALESISGMDLPDDMVDKVVQAVKGKMAGDKISDAVDSLKKMF